METMIITPNPSDPEVKILSNEFKKKGFNVQYFVPSTIKVNIGFHSRFEKRFERLTPRAALVRGFGAAATQKIFFRLDILRAIEEHNVKLINSRESLEIASDKFLTSMFLEKYKIPTPKTIICEDPNAALEGFEELGGDCVLKPLFGSKGIGITRLNEKAFGEKIVITDYETKEFYEGNPTSFSKPEQIKASHILVKVDAQSKDTDKEAAKKKITSIQQKIKDGEQ